MIGLGWRTLVGVWMTFLAGCQVIIQPRPTDDEQPATGAARASQPSGQTGVSEDDSLAWQIARAQNTPASYQGYLRTQPNGYQADTAVKILLACALADPAQPIAADVMPAGFADCATEVYGG